MAIRVSDYIEASQLEDAAPAPPGWHVLLLITLFLCGAGDYANMLGNAFVMRDISDIVTNERLHELGTSFYGSRAVSNLTFGMNYAIGELEASGYHATNLLIHLLVGLTLYGVVRCTLTTSRLRRRFGDGSVWIAFACSLLWLVHPLQTEVVSYCANRADSLVALFYLLTIYCVLRGVTSDRGTIWYVGAVAACALGMGTKATMVTAPIALLIFDRAYLSRSLSSLLKRRGLLYAGLFGTWIVLYFNGVLTDVFAPSATRSSETGASALSTTPIEYAMTQGGVILHYLKLSFWPRTLCVDYQWNPVRSPMGRALLPILITSGLGLWAMVTLIRRPAVGFVAIWFFLILAPTSSVLPHLDPLSENRMYLPLAGIVVLVVLGAHALLQEVFARSAGSRLGVGVCLLLFVAPPLAYGTLVRNQDYKDNVTIWTDVTDKRPANYRGVVGVGLALQALGEFVDAEAALRRAVVMSPESPDANFHLGDLLFDQRRHEDAFEMIQRSVELGRRDAAAFVRLGASATAMGRYEEAVGFFDRALSDDPDLAPTHNQRGDALMLLDRTEEAVTSYQQAVRLDADYFEAHQGLSIALAKLDRLDEALKSCDEALKLRPTDEGANLQRRLILQKIAAQPKPVTIDVTLEDLEPGAANDDADGDGDDD